MDLAKRYYRVSRTVVARCPEMRPQVTRTLAKLILARKISEQQVEIARRLAVGVPTDVAYSRLWRLQALKMRYMARKRHDIL